MNRAVNRLLMRERLLDLVTAACLGMAAPSLAAEVNSVVRLPRIGMLALNAAQPVYLPAQGVIAALRERGWIDGKSMLIEMRHADDDPSGLPALAQDLVQRRVDVIVAYTNATAFVAKAATSDIPIVFWGGHGSVATGLVASLAHPGGNLTGVETLAPELDAKRLQLMKELLPKLKQVDVLHNALDAGTPVHLTYVAQGARQLGMTTRQLAMRGPADMEPALASLAARPARALLTLTDDLTVYAWRSGKVSRIATSHRVPTVCEFEFMVQMGCLLAYGPDFEEFHQRVATQIDRILKGAKPTDLPVEQPTRFKLVINLKTAKALGITVPQELLLRADEVIE
jgi:putative ABC transport system substrate-binding protein